MIHLANNEGRDAQIETASVKQRQVKRLTDANGDAVRSVRLIKSTHRHDLAALHDLAAAQSQSLAELLTQQDAELDLEIFGRMLLPGDTNRVYVGTDGRPLHKVRLFELLYDAGKTLLEERPLRDREKNVLDDEQPLRVSKRLIKIGEALRSFVFGKVTQLRHRNGLEYDFLYAIAAKLEAEQSVAALGAGPKGNGPLVFQRNAIPRRAFISGRTSGKDYALLMHLTNLELKAPVSGDEDDS